VIDIKVIPGKKEVSYIKENAFVFSIVFLLSFMGNLNQWIISGNEGIFLKNFLWHIVGIGILFSFTLWGDYRKFVYQFVFPLYLGVLLLLIFIDITALITHTKDRWIHLGPISIQPSEFLKPILVCLISFMVYEGGVYFRSFDEKKLLKIFAMIGFPLLLVLVTDLDYSFIMGISFFVFLLFIGIPRRILIFLGIGFLIFSIFIVPILWRSLKPYQKGRIYGYLYPERYARTWAYQLNQSLIAIGDGGLLGHGLKKGWSTRLNYLPAKHTDLAFAVWAETWGFLGVSLFLLLYGYLIFFAIDVSRRVKDFLGKYISLGIALLFLFQLLFNVGGCSGLLPMTSIPLPFLSYGGSITISSYFLLSLVFNVNLKAYSFK